MYYPLLLRLYNISLCSSTGKCMFCIFCCKSMCLLPDIADRAAGDLAPGVSGGLRREVVRLAMDRYRSAGNILHAKAVRDHCQVCAPLAGQQRRKIARVQRVFPTMGIVVAAGIGKAGPGTVSIFMDAWQRNRSPSPAGPPFALSPAYLPGAA